jgi:hypothetical protein
LAGFEVTTIGRFWGDHRGVDVDVFTKEGSKQKNGKPCEIGSGPRTKSRRNSFLVY